MPIDSSENLSRYVIYRKYIRPSDGTARPAAFMPPDNGELSVFRTTTVSEEAVWEIGDREVASKIGRPILGRADILCGKILSLHLEVHASEPPPRHANITGWPEDKSERLLIAVNIAAEARYISKPVFAR